MRSLMLDMDILAQSFYEEGDVVEISKRLLGKYIVTDIDNQVTVSRIVETEAYNGSLDKACHAYQNRRTPRTSVMFEGGGRSYVYLCYGIHELFNIVTNEKDQPNAVLLRAVEPVMGLDIMESRRKVKDKTSLTNGPGKLAKALGINRTLNNVLLYQPDSPIWIAEDEQVDYDIVQTQRIGVDYAGEDASLPWRFYLKDNPYVSRK